MKTKKILFCFIFISIYIQNIFSEKVYLEVSSGVSKWVYTISIEEYNKQGKIIYEKTFLAGGAAWRERRFEYDKKGNRIITFETGDKKTYYTFDAEGKEIHFITSDKFEVWNEYDKQGNKIRTADSDGNETLFVYNNDNLLISKKEISKKIEKDETLYFYDDNKKLTYEKSKNIEIKYEYDNMGRYIYKEIIFNGITLHKNWYEYDDKGNLIYQKDENENEFWYKNEFYKNGIKKKVVCYGNL